MNAFFNPFCPVDEGSFNLTKEFQSQALIIQESYNQSGVKTCFSSKETQLNVIG